MGETQITASRARYILARKTWLSVLFYEFFIRTLGSYKKFVKENTKPGFSGYEFFIRTLGLYKKFVKENTKPGFSG